MNPVVSELAPPLPPGGGRGGAAANYDVFDKLDQEINGGDDGDGDDDAVIAVGGVMSALEVVPLVLIGFEAYNHAKIEAKAHWLEYYKWPLMFFSAVLFWNFIGAGLFGFLINPPLALYYRVYIKKPDQRLS